MPIGTTLRDYVVERILGEGGFGITYLGRHSLLGMPVAIKEYMPNEFAQRVEGLSIRPFTHAEKKEFFNYGLDRFLTEAKALVRFDHPNIIKAKDYFEENGTAYIVMDYAEGQNLESWLRLMKSPPEEKVLKNIFLPILDGLSEVHAQRLLHRDISPDNIYLQERGQPLLIDFGAARNQLVSKSQSLGVLVKEGYSPKEQYAANGRQGPYTDIYALGASMYRCLSGRTPPGSTTRIDDMDHGEQDPLIPAVQAFRGEYSDTLLTTIDWCLQLNSAHRPQTIGEMQEAIAGNTPSLALTVPRPGIIQNEHEEVDVELAPDETGPWYKSKYILPSIFGFLTICLIGAVGFIVLSGKEQPSDESPVASLPPGDTASSDDVRLEAELVQSQATDKFKNLNELNVVISKVEMQRLQDDLSEIDKRMENDATAALDLGRTVDKNLDIVISTASRKFRSGSSAIDIQEAHQECVSALGELSCPLEWFELEQQLSVELRPFVIDKSEVTFRDFQSFVDQQGYITTAEKLGASLQQGEDFELMQLEGYAWNTPEGKRGRGLEELLDHPVVHVSHTDAKNYCQFHSKRLPTQPEWEYALSGGAMHDYASYFSLSTYDASGHARSEISSQPSRSDSLYDSSTGLYAGTGNVWEWTDTPDPRSSERRMTKGGSWNEPAAAFVRIASLRPEYMQDSYIDVGFRCAQDSRSWPGN